MKVVITDCSWNAYDVEIKHLPQDAEVVCCQISDEDTLIEACKDADAAMCEYAPFTRRVMEACPRLKLISVTAIGVDCVDTKAGGGARVADGAKRGKAFCARPRPGGNFAHRGARTGAVRRERRAIYRFQATL